MYFHPETDANGKWDIMFNKKKSIAVMLIICNLLFLLTGCGNQIPEMTDAENELVTEYAAGLLLKYHSKYEGRLVDTSVSPQEGQETEQETEMVSDNSADREQQEQEVSEPGLTVSSNGVTKGNAGVQISAAQLLGSDGFEMKYSSFEVCDTYPETGSAPEVLFFSMKAGNGNKLLVLRIDIVNNNTSEAQLDTLGMTELGCEVIINGKDTQRAYISMLENDFMTISRTFAPGEVYEAAVITEVPEDKAATITTVALRLKNGDRKTVVELAE